MIHAECGFFTSSPNHYAVCGWKVAPGYWSKRRRQERAESRERRAAAKRVEQAIRDRGDAPHQRKCKPRDVWLAGLITKWYVRGALARVADGDRAIGVQATTARVLESRHRFGYTEEEAIGLALAYARGFIYSPDPTPPPSPHPYGKAR